MPLPRARSTLVSMSTTRRDLEPLAARWQRALDAGDRALRAAADSLPAAYLAPRRRALVEERRQTADLLVRVAREQGIEPPPWLSPVPIDKRMLGLDTAVEASLFDLDGVLTDSNRLHANAWGTVLDDLLLRSSEQTGWQFIPFDRDRDYRTYIDGRSRLEGIHAFLESRGIRLPEGRSDDPPEAETACGLANRKGADGEAGTGAARRDAAPGCPALSGGGRPHRPPTRRDLRQREHAADARARSARTALRGSDRRGCHRRPKALTRLRLPTCCSRPAGASTFLPSLP